MAERPLLILPPPSEPSRRSTKNSGRGRYHNPGRARQAQRLGPQFESLQAALDERRTRLRGTAQGILPEEVVVFETVGTVDGFMAGVRNIDGLEWLAEIEETEIPPDDDFFATSRSGRRKVDKTLRGRLFMIFTNQAALRQMLSLWESWKRGEDLPRGLKSWRRLFEQLRDVRPWGLRDRLLETGVLEDWRERVEHGDQVVPCEIELWYRSSQEQRVQASRRARTLVSGAEGEVLNEAVIDEIAYHALLVRVPLQSIESLLENAHSDVELIQCEQIQFFRASGQMAGVVPEGESETDVREVDGTFTGGAPNVALFDGFPLQNHRRLQNRLLVDDPDEFEPHCPPLERRHGTAMASLLIWGDIGTGSGAFTRPIYVRPILRPDSRAWRTPRPETVPEDQLVVDLIHRAVRRLFEGEGNQQPVAPEVKIINLSIGILDRLFDGALSPLARLLDWLAWRYSVLFVVSAGNHSHNIEIDVPKGELGTLSTKELERHVLQAVAADARHRRLLSPAEAVNVLTVGAVHHDTSENGPPPRWLHTFENGGLPSPVNAQGMGYRRSIKPELLAEGGRIVVQEDIRSEDTVSLQIYRGTLEPGQLVASTGSTEGETNAIWATRGTSNATALVTRSGAVIDDLLTGLRDEPGGDLIDSVPRACWIKALLNHGAHWDDAEGVLEEILRTDDNSRQFREYITRLIGYGRLNLERVLECTAQRTTALSGGVLEEDQQRVHQFPLPTSLSGKRGHRRLTITLAWLTPVNPRHQSWRRAHLWFEPPSDPLRIEREQADWRAVQRGTLQHEILTGEDASVFVSGAEVEIEVNCRADAGRLDSAVPYALAVTLEVAEELGIEIYDEIRDRIRARVRIEPGG